jgi:hypothetical protein
MSDVLDQIEQDAIRHEGEQEAAQAAQENPQAAINPAAAWAQIPAAVGGILGMAMPELASVYNEGACMQWGEAMHQVAEKYGWDAAETISRFAPEVAIVVATIPLVVPTVGAFKARRALAEASKPQTVTIDTENASQAQQEAPNAEASAG